MSVRLTSALTGAADRGRGISPVLGRVGSRLGIRSRPELRKVGDEAGERLYLDLRHVDAIPHAYRYRSDELMAASGVNLGNLVFRHAMPLIVDGFERYRTVDYWQLLDVVNSRRVSHVLVSCANWLGTRPQDEIDNAFRAKCFEKADAPITAFGLGVQAEAGVSRVELGRKTIRMARVLSERAISLSVRDVVTQDTLAKVGVRNTVVTGCPSNFINPDPTIGHRISDRARALVEQRPAWSELRTLVAEASGGNEHASDVLRTQVKLMAANPAFYVIQSPAILSFILNETEALSDLYLSSNPFRDVSQLRRVLRAKALHFSSVEAWMDFARTCHISIGMRIHGAMVPLQVGVPSLIIVHDARTAGLATEMGIPTVSPEDYLRLWRRGPARFGSIIAEVMEAYDDRRSTLARAMRDHVIANGLAPHRNLLALTGPSHTA